MKEERTAFERHLLLLESQNHQLINELDEKVKTSEELQRIVDKRERVMELKEKMANQRM